MKKAIGEKAGESFEEKLKALEQVVARLERDDVPLEEAIGLYEKGVVLHKACEAVLADAKLRIEKLGAVAEDGEDPQAS